MSTVTALLDDMLRSRSVDAPDIARTIGTTPGR
jgi:hypothetical protein